MAPKATPSKILSTPNRVKTKGVVKKKRKGRLSNQALRRISDSSFNVAQLSGSRISTPRDRNKKRLRSNLLTGANNPGSSRKRKLSVNNSPQVNRKAKRVALNTNTPYSPAIQSPLKPSSSTNQNPEPNGEPNSNIALSVKPIKSLKSPKRPKPRLPIDQQTKSANDLKTLFRNNHIGPADNLGKEMDSVILIEDDETTIKDSDKTEVESVGEELMNLAQGSNVPETPRTIIEKMMLNQENNHETITLDDTEDTEDKEDGTNSPDSIILLEPDTEENQSVQEIAAKYFTTPTTLDFIPLPTGTENTRFQKQRPRNHKQQSNTRQRDLNPNSNRGRPFPRSQHPSFNPNLPPNMAFGSEPVPSEVYNFTGGRSRGNVASILGPTMYSDDTQIKSGLRPIVIDGSNVAFAHGRGSQFSVKGIEMVINYFKDRKHDHVVAFLPQFRVGTNFKLLSKMETEGTVIFTPSRTVDGQRINSYDDRMILDYAVEKGAIVISKDNYRDMFQENSKYHETIKMRLLMPTFVGDTLMFPQDPLGRNGPMLDEFLRF